MTAAQKIAKEKFKKAIAIRSKTGVSLKEAFAEVYGKKKAQIKKVASNVKKLVDKAKKAYQEGYNEAAMKSNPLMVKKRKVGAVKKKAAKKTVKKVAKKVVQKTEPRYSAKKHKNWATIPEHKRRVNGLPKKKKVSEQSILNKIHKVKEQVNSLDELQHKHMIGSIDKYKNLQNEIKSYEAAIRKLKSSYYGLNSVDKVKAKLLLKKLMNAKNELKTHAAQLKKSF
jgi:hypothetical protein